MALNPQYLQPRTDVRGYLVVDQLGAGGLATVYKVERDGKPFALKIATYSVVDLTTQDRAQLDTRAKREFGFIAQLEDPYIVRVHEFFRFPASDDYPVLVMDFVEGLPLYDWQRKNNPSLRAIATVFIKLAGSLHRMHKHDVFHRDLKSGNVLVRLNQDPVIIDFNIARPGSAYTLTVAGGLVGTPSHFTPEYCEWFRTPEPKADFEFGPPQELHCLGFMLYEMLSGRTPRPLGEDSFQTMGRIERLPPQPLEEQVPPGVPAGLCNVVMKLLECDPKKRFLDGAQLRETLEGILGALPDTPYECPLPQRSSHSSSASGSSSGVPENSAERNSASHASAFGQPGTTTKVDRARPRRPRRLWATVLGATTAISMLGGGTWWIVNSRSASPSPAVPAPAANDSSNGEGTGRPEQPRPKIVLPETVVPGKAPEPVVPAPAASPALIVPAPSAAPIPLAVAHNSPAPAKALGRTGRNEAVPASPPTTEPELSNGVLVRMTQPGAEQPSAPAALAGTGGVLGVPAGTRLSVRLSTDVAATPGAPVEAMLTLPLIYNTKSILPSRTRLTGTVETVNGPRVLLRFRTALLPVGKQVHLNAQALPNELQAGTIAEAVLADAL